MKEQLLNKISNIVTNGEVEQFPLLATMFSKVGFCRGVRMLSSVCRKGFIREMDPIADIYMHCYEREKREVSENSRILIV